MSRTTGSESSATRDLLLDRVERLMVEKGYAAVSYRAVARAAGVTGGLVQYYFPTIDDLLVASVRRSFERNIGRLEQALRTSGDRPLTRLWEYSHDEANAALINEYMALGNHRESVRAVVADVTERVRVAQLAAIRARFADRGDRIPSAEALLFLITGVPKLLQLEEGLGVTLGHADVERLFANYLERLESEALDP
jgi:AcrR family transcriptional regulator